MKKLYQCEICGYTSDNKQEIIECENRGEPIPLVKIGDIIYFRDCKETPIVYNEIYNKENAELRLRYYASFSRSGVSRAMHMAAMFININVKYKIYKINVTGHDIEYFLRGIPGVSNSFYGTDDNFEHVWDYPVIKGNNLMKKILEKYNNTNSIH